MYTKATDQKEDDRKITRVLLADDHAVVRAGIRHLLKKAPDIQVVGEARNGEEALRLSTELIPDVLLLDLEMPSINGIDVAIELQKLGSPVRILVLSAYEDKQYILGLLENGVSGYLTKDEVPEVIIDAVRGVSQGEEGWVSPRVAAQMSRSQNPMSRRLIELNQLELQVLSLISQHQNDHEIGEALGIQEKTVVRHVQTICFKLGAVSRTGILDAARQAGLIS
ncbi:MAG TPA: response regulator transcription factor [Anaerolineaceae bacterium]|nr:response regulator transcription factor [Anaerolineaceae bacterium]